MKPMILFSVWLAATSTAIAQPTKTVGRTIPLPATGSVTLETHNGSIEVQTWDRAEIEIHAGIQAAGTWSDDVRRFDQTTVDIQSTADSVWIKSRYPTFTTWTWFGSNARIDYKITAPKTARWTIYDHNASVDVRGVQAAITIETHNGRVHLSDVAGPLRVGAHNGSVTGDLASFRGAEFTSHLGSLDLTLPSTAAFHLQADSRRGSIQSDFPLAIRMLGRRHTTVDGEVNGGGPSLRFHSHAGKLRLQSKN